ncbi:MAG TPA: UdgX family uracil-DNA binding protein [Kofleriaceae bacterium]|jgi:DNA polymerase
MTAAEYLPARATLPALRRAAASCHGCPLYRGATQTVFGEGPARARVMLVGEEPGDREDLAGHPFVGPAGKLLDEALAHAKIARADVYLTNAVKHFKFEKRGKRRIHQKPTVSELKACKPWLSAELAAVKPEVLVVLGASAAYSILGPRVKVTQVRGQRLSSELAAAVFATVHPAAVLRADDRAAARAALFADLDAVGAYLRRT